MPDEEKTTTSEITEVNENPVEEESVEENVVDTVEGTTETTATAATPVTATPNDDWKNHVFEVYKIYLKNIIKIKEDTIKIYSRGITVNGIDVMFNEGIIASNDKNTYSSQTWSDWFKIFKSRPQYIEKRHKNINSAFNKMINFSREIENVIANGGDVNALFDSIKNGTFVPTITASAAPRVLPKIVRGNVPSTQTTATHPRNKIWFGAPGTGKSYTLNLKKDFLLGAGSTHFKRVTFHPEYRYGNFVGSYKPVSEKDAAGNDIIKYKFVPGAFLDIYVEAATHTDKKYLLIIEEINRANVAAVFGDVFQLLDRDGNGDSVYAIDTNEDVKRYLADKKVPNPGTMSIPGNMYIWATMNSADQGVFPLDTAFKRRWEFEYIQIDKGEGDIIQYNFDIGNKTYNWNDVRHDINNYLTRKNINEDKQLGAHFLSKTILEQGNDEIIAAIKSKVIMYLYEDAAKQYRRTLFGGRSYSQIISDFDNIGMDVFNFNS